MACDPCERSALRVQIHLDMLCREFPDFMAVFFLTDGVAIIGHDALGSLVLGLLRALRYSLHRPDDECEEQDGNYASEDFGFRAHGLFSSSMTVWCLPVFCSSGFVFQRFWNQSHCVGFSRMTCSTIFVMRAVNVNKSLSASPVSS